MKAASHALIGTMIAAKVGEPALAIGLSFASHFVADIIPHWDSGTHWREKTKIRLQLESVADVLTGFILSFILYGFILQTEAEIKAGPLLVFAAIIASQAPDWVTAPKFIFGRDFPGSEFMYQVQHKLNTKLDKPWGIVTQIVALTLLYLILFVIF